MVVPPVSGIPQDTGILCLVLYHSFGKIRDFFRRRGRFFCGSGDFCLSNGGGCAILITVCGRGGIGRLDGFRFHCHTACGFESRRPHQKPAGATGGLPVFYARVRAVPLINGSCDANALIRLPFSSSTQLCSSISGQLPSVRIDQLPCFQKAAVSGLPISCLSYLYGSYCQFRANTRCFSRLGKSFRMGAMRRRALCPFAA